MTPTPRLAQALRVVSRLTQPLSGAQLLVVQAQHPQLLALEDQAELAMLRGDGQAAEGLLRAWCQAWKTAVGGIERLPRAAAKTRRKRA